MASTATLEGGSLFFFSPPHQEPTLMLFNKSLIILFSTVALLSGVFGITSEEKRLRRQRAEAADKQLKFAPVHDIPTLVSQKGLTLLFFGAHWCKYTQLFTPKVIE